MSLRLGCGTAGTTFGLQNIASSIQTKQRSQRLNSLRSRHAPTHIEQWISLISAELQILLPLEYPWLHVAKPCFLLVRYCMLLTRRSLKDSCTAVFKLHVSDTMQNIAFALFTLHAAHNLSSFFIYFQIICNLIFAFFKLHVVHTMQNFVFVVLFIACGLHMTESFFLIFHCMWLAYCRISILSFLYCLWSYIVKTL